MTDENPYDPPIGPERTRATPEVVRSQRHGIQRALLLVFPGFTLLFCWALLTQNSLIEDLLLPAGIGLVIASSLVFWTHRFIEIFAGAAVAVLWIVMHFAFLALLSLMIGPNFWWS